MNVTPPPAAILFPKLRLPLFEDEQFAATKFDSGADKAKFANHLLRFIGTGFPEAFLNKPFYNRLSMCFSNIAHYNKHGFWDHFFTSTDRRIAFLDQMQRGGGYGDSAWTYCDVELAVRKRLHEGGVMEAYRQARSAEIIEAERATLRRLKAQYESEPLVDLAKPPAQPTGYHGPAVQLGLF